MNKTAKIILAIVIIGLLAGGVMFYRTWFKPHRDAMDETAVTVSAQSLADAFNTDEQKANTIYLDKAIEVSGEVANVIKTDQGKTVVSLKTSDPMAGVRCTMKEDVSPQPGSQATIRGLCSGFLMDVTLVECSLVEGK